MAKLHAGRCVIVSNLFVFAAVSGASGGSDDPFADVVIEYVEGIDASPGYTDSSVAIGSPERFTGEGLFPAVVSPFNPPWGIDEVVSIGRGGSLTLKFNTPVTDDPRNAFGIDLIVFGNTGFIDDFYPSGIVGGFFGNDGGIVQVSADGKDWRTVPIVKADSKFPTNGYLDSGHYDLVPGSVHTSFTRPLNPALTLADFMGLDHAGVLNLYRGSGGGAGIDLADVDLPAIQYIRIINPLSNTANIEIDAVADASPLGDINSDGVVGPADLGILLGSWGVLGPVGSLADLDYDGVVGPADLGILLGTWG